MKKKFLAVFASLFVFGSVSSFAFDWSQCWCNYGGGVEKGDFILHVDAGLGDWLVWNAYDWYYDTWSAPYVEVGLNYAGSIGKLPFTFGGFVGADFHGYKDSGYGYTWTTISFGGDIAYHIQLPPEIIDVYTGLRLGGKVALLFTDLDVEDKTDFDILYDPYIGANFFFTDSFGLNVELAYENWIRAGLSFKF